MAQQIQYKKVVEAPDVLYLIGVLSTILVFFSLIALSSWDGILAGEIYEIFILGNLFGIIIGILLIIIAYYFIERKVHWEKI